MKKILFLIHDLGHGGAEKVLVNLVNNMNPELFDITIIALFGGGVNEQFLKPHIHYRAVFKKPFRGNSHIMKLFSPKQLYKRIVKEKFDIEIAYLEGPDARIISGCDRENVKRVCWIHIEQKTEKRAKASFRNYKEAISCYRKFDQFVCVSETVKQDFLQLFPIDNTISVLYNTNETKKILEMAQEDAKLSCNTGDLKLVGVGKLLKNKGFDRLASIVRRLLKEGYPVHLFILGVGPLQPTLEEYIKKHNLSNHITLLGYQTNPYKYVAAADLFVCASFAEGFSTAATEALIVGTPVCTVEVSGMKEMLGDNNEYGIVTENDEEALYQGIKRLLDDPALLTHYTKQAALRGKDFNTEATVKAVEEMLLGL